MKKIFLSTSAALLACASSASAQVIYNDTFAGTSALTGTMPTTPTGGNGGTANAAWTAGPDWTNASGSTSVTLNNAAQAASVSENAFLPFTPQTGFVYTLSANLSVSGNATDAWVALGFSQGATTSTHFYDNNPTGWVLIKQSSQSSPAYGFAGPSTANLAVSGTGTQGATYRITLNTIDANDWTATFSGAGLTTTTFDYGSSISGITDVGLGAYLYDQNTNDSTTYTVSDFTLSAMTAPEPSTFALLLGGAALLLMLNRRIVRKV